MLALALLLVPSRARASGCQTDSVVTHCAQNQAAYTGGNSLTTSTALTLTGTGDMVLIAAKVTASNNSISSGDITVSSTDCTGYTFHSIVDPVKSTNGEVDLFYTTGTASASSCHFKMAISETNDDLAITAYDVPKGISVDVSNGQSLQESGGTLTPNTGSVTTNYASELLFWGLQGFISSGNTWGTLSDTNGTPTDDGPNNTTYGLFDPGHQITTSTGSYDVSRPATGTYSSAYYAQAAIAGIILATPTPTPTAYVPTPTPTPTPTPGPTSTPTPTATPTPQANIPPITSW